MKLSLRPIDYSDALMAPLLAEAADHGGSFLFRLREEWLAGILRFDRPGEILLGAFTDEILAAVGGISRDPYAPAAGLGRVRHVYVLAAMRGRGIGRALIEALIGHGRGHFARLRLSTDRREAARLYESLGFVPAAADRQTHLLIF